MGGESASLSFFGGQKSLFFIWSSKWFSRAEFSITREKYYVYIKGWFQRKKFQFKVFKYFSRISLSMKCLQLQFTWKQAVLWTQHFLKRPILPQKWKFLYDLQKMKANLYDNSTFQVNRTNWGTLQRNNTLFQATVAVVSAFL